MLLGYSLPISVVISLGKISESEFTNLKINSNLKDKSSDFGAGGDPQSRKEKAICEAR